MLSKSRIFLNYGLSSHNALFWGLQGICLVQRIGYDDKNTSPLYDCLFFSVIAVVS